LDTVQVNGPEGDPDWDSVDWGQAEGNVRRLRQRIFTASQAGDLARVRNLQKLMLRSRANARVSVRRVTEVNAGRATAGIDGKVALLHKVWQEAGRDGEPRVTALAGKPDPELLAHWAGIGVTDVAFGLPDRSPDEVVGYLGRLAGRLGLGG